MTREEALRSIGLTPADIRNHKTDPLTAEVTEVLTSRLMGTFESVFNDLYGGELDSDQILTATASAMLSHVKGAIEVKSLSPTDRSKFLAALGFGILYVKATLEAEGFPTKEE